MKISVSIVYYKVPDLVIKCIESVRLALQGIDSEIIVLDNDSQDNGKECVLSLYPDVNWKTNNENIGFGKAHNQNIKDAKGEFILILNPDTIVPDYLFTELINFSQSKPYLGVAGVQLKNSNGVFLPESKRNIPTLLNAFEKEIGIRFLPSHKRYYAHQLKTHETNEVPILSGACMWMRKDVFEDLKGFDPRFFMYAEDIDLCITSLKKGYKNYYKGDLQITHLKGRSAAKNPKSVYYFHQTMKQFIDKHYSSFWKRNLYKLLVNLSALKSSIFK